MTTGWGVETATHPQHGPSTQKVLHTYGLKAEVTALACKAPRRSSYTQPPSHASPPCAAPGSVQCCRERWLLPPHNERTAGCQALREILGSILPLETSACRILIPPTQNYIWGEITRFLYIGKSKTQADFIWECGLSLGSWY